MRRHTPGRRSASARNPLAGVPRVWRGIWQQPVRPRVVCPRAGKTEPTGAEERGERKSGWPLGPPFSSPA